MALVNPDPDEPTLICEHCGGVNRPVAQRCRDCHLTIRGTTESRGAEPGSAIIPTKNPAALTAYYLAIFALIPFFGGLLGIGAFVLGLRGLKAVRVRPEIKGTAHAWIGVVLGGLIGFGHVAGLLWLLLRG